MQLEINSKKVELKISIWMVDEDRYQKMKDEKPDSIIWDLVSLFWTAHKNHIRRFRNANMPEVVTLDELEIWVDDMLCTEEGKKYLVDKSSEIAEEIKKLSVISGATEEKKIQPGVKQDPSLSENWDLTRQNTLTSKLATL